MNTLQIREHLGRLPAADRLLVNMLRYAANEADRPSAVSAPDLDVQLKSLGYPE